MYTLYIDTHDKTLTIALFLNEVLIVEEHLLDSIHSKDTINLINKVLNKKNLTVKNLNEVIVINGPGSFTGVRIGIVISKILSYTLNISLKSLSYLEAMSLNFGEDVTVGLEDKNGIYIASFDKYHNLISPYKYLSKSDIANLDIKTNIKVNLPKVYKYMQTKPSLKPDTLTPLYIKKIEVEK